MSRRIRIRTGVGEPGDDVIFAPTRERAIAETWHMATAVSDALLCATRHADEHGVPQIVEVTVDPATDERG